MELRIDTDHGVIAPYAMMILLSFLAGTCGMFLLNLRRGIRRQTALRQMLLSPLLSLCGGIALTFLTSGGRQLGLSSLGGLCGMYAACALAARLSRQRGYGIVMTQNCTLILPLMYSIGKIGCFLGGCCGGIPYNGAFRTIYTGVHANPVPALPIQLIESIVFLLIFLAGLYGFFRRRINTVPAVFFASAASKFMLDFLRASHQGNILSITQILCAGMLIAALLLLLHRHRQQRKHAGKE